MHLYSDGAGGYRAKMTWSKTPGGVNWGGFGYTVNADWSMYKAIRITLSGMADTNHGLVMQYTCLQADGKTVVPFNYEVHVTDDGRGDWPLLSDGTLTLPLDQFKMPTYATGNRDLKSIVSLTLSVMTDRGKSFSFDDIVLVGDEDTTTSQPSTPKASSAPRQPAGSATASSVPSTSSVGSSSQAANSLASAGVSGSASSATSTASKAGGAGLASSSSETGAEPSGGLPAEAIAGIIAGIVVLAGAGVLLYLFVFKKKVA